MPNRNAIVLIAGLLSVFAFYPPALAQSASEIAEMKAQLRLLQARIEQLEAQSRQSQAPAQAVASAPQGAAQVPAQTAPSPGTAPTPNSAPPAPASAQGASSATAPKVVASGNDKVKLALSGQINRAVLLYDDGKRTDAYHVDNNNSSTRVRLLGEAVVDKETSVLSALEFDLRSNSSASVTRFGEESNGGDTPTLGPFRLRRAEVAASSKTFGALWMGRGSTATDGIAQIDKSGTSLAMYSALSDTAGSLQIANKAGRLAGDPTIASVTDDLDGFRDDRLMYQTPSYEGFMLSTSWAQGGYWDAALRYARKFGGIDVAAGIGYADLRVTAANQLNPAAIDDKVVGSVSVMLANGLNATVSGGRASAHLGGREAPTNVYFKLGYLARFFEIGTTAFSIDAGETRHRALDGDRARRYGVQVAQAFSDYGAEIYAGLEFLSLDRRGAAFEDATIALTGARVQF